MVKRETRGSVPWSGRSPGEGNGNPLQYPCLENSMDWGAWQATVHGVTESDTTKQLNILTSVRLTLSWIPYTEKKEEVSRIHCIPTGCQAVRFTSGLGMPTLLRGLHSKGQMRGMKKWANKNYIKNLQCIQKWSAAQVPWVRAMFWFVTLDSQCLELGLACSQ